MINLNRIRLALCDPKAPWYGSDVVGWVDDLITDYERLLRLTDGVEMARLPDPVRLRDWRRKRQLSLIPMADDFLKCSIVEASTLERGEPVRAGLVKAAEEFLAKNPE